jgi:hypothetical protein
MKKYILLIGFVMASVDCSAGEDNLPGLHIPGTLIKSLLAAAQSYVPSVMALLAAIKGQSSQPTADQSAPAGGGGAVEMPQDYNVSGFNIGITQDLMNRLRLSHDDLTKKISESNKKHVAFLRTISSERPDLQTLINSYEDSGDALLVAMQGLLAATGGEKNLPNYGFLAAAMRGLLTRLQQLNTEYSEILDLFESKNHTISCLEDNLATERTDHQTKLAELRAELDALKATAEAERLRVNAGMETLRAELANERVKSAEKEAASQRRELNSQRFSLGTYVLVGAVCLFTGGLIEKFKDPIGLRIGNSLDVAASAGKAVYSGVKSVAARMPFLRNALTATVTA